MSIAATERGTTAQSYPDSRNRTYHYGSGYVAPAGVYDKFETLYPSGYKLTTKTQMVIKFDSGGKPTRSLIATAIPPLLRSTDRRFTLLQIHPGRRSHSRTMGVASSHRLPTHLVELSHSHTAVVSTTPSWPA